jgi:hypothetical protein
MSKADVAHLLNLLSGYLGLVAAALWFRASRIKTPPKLKGIDLGDQGFGGELPELFTGVLRQSQWNSWAAVAAALAAIAASIGAFLSPSGA